MAEMREELTNVEFMLLQILAQEGEKSGYEINTLVEERGYREWADIGTTSIYLGLSKLEKRGFIESRIDNEKQGKGPLPKKLHLKQTGWEVLRQAIMEGLSREERRSGRFDLALASFPVAGKDESVRALRSRLNALKEGLIRVQDKYQKQGGESLPFHVRELFRHNFVQIETETTFVEELIDRIERGGR